MKEIKYETIREYRERCCEADRFAVYGNNAAAVSALPAAEDESCEEKKARFTVIDGKSPNCRNGQKTQGEQAGREERTLTAAGAALCMVLGFAEEVLIYLFFGIVPTSFPLFVSLFLAFSLAVVSYGGLLAADWCREQIPDRIRNGAFHFSGMRVY